MGYIIDISEHNTITDWSKLAKEVDTVILRLGYRGSLVHHRITMDAKFLTHLAKAKKYNVPYAVYFFPTSITDEEAVEEANWIHDQIEGLDLCMPVFLDSENVKSDRSGRADKLSKSTRTRLLKIISDKLLSYGIPCGVYSYTSWLNNNIDLSQLDNRVIDNTWVAQNPVLTYGGKVAMWQYGTKTFSWSKGPIDVDKIVDGFNMEVKSVDYYRSVIVDKAVSYLGTTMGSTKHKQIVDAYNKYTSSHKGPWRAYTVKYTDYWCATFVSAIAIMCDYTAIIPIECGCPQMITQAKNMGIWQENDAYVPKPGDIILYDWDDSGKGDNTGTPDHIGYVRTVSGNQITVVEGNSGSAQNVAERKLAVNGKYIRGFITPKYTAASPSGAKTDSKKITLTINLPELRRGDKNPAVGLWQYLIGAKTDCDFGQKTETATKEWQKANGKTVDGWVGKGCWTKMMQIKGWM